VLRKEDNDLGEEMYGVCSGARTRSRPKKTRRAVVEKDCQDAMDHSRCMKQIRDD